MPKIGRLGQMGQILTEILFNCGRDMYGYFTEAYKTLLSRFLTLDR